MKLVHMADAWRGQVAAGVQTFVASFLLAAGICLFVEAGLGSDSIDVLLDGMSRSLGITLGQADQIYVLVTTVVALVVNRRRVGVWSIVGGFAASLMIDVVNGVVMPLELAQQALPVRAAALVLGQLGISCAYGIYQTIAHGMNVGDAIALRLSEVLPGSYTAWRMVYDGACLVAGVLIGGVFGVGTVLYVLVNGTIVTRTARAVTALKRRVRMAVAA